MSKEVEICEEESKTDAKEDAEMKMDMAKDAEGRDPEEEKSDKVEDEEEEGTAPNGKMEHPEKVEEEEHEPEMKKKREEEAAKYSAVEMELRQARADLRLLKRKDALQHLSTEGYTFNLDEELNGSIDLDDDNFGKHVVEKIKKYSGRAPIGVKVSDELSRAPIDKTGPTQKELGELTNYCLANGLDFRQEYFKKWN